MHFFIDRKNWYRSTENNTRTIVQIYSNNNTTYTALTFESIQISFVKHYLILPIKFLKLNIPSIVYNLKSYFYESSIWKQHMTKSICFKEDLPRGLALNEHK